MALRIEVNNSYGVETVVLENDMLRAVILPGKGCDLIEFIWKNGNINCLYRSDIPAEAYRELDLKEQRLSCHSDRSFGGWMEALPHRGLYRDIELTQETGGTAATLPWDYSVEQGDDELRLRCHVLLPMFPLEIIKVFALCDKESGLRISERVTHRGDMPMRFTWTQHAMFGGDFVDGQTRVLVPARYVFDAWAYAANPERGIDAFRFPVQAASLRQGIVDLTRPLPIDYPGNEFVVFQGLEEGIAILQNPNKKLSITLKWDLARFSYLRSLFQSRGGYIIGLEPGDDCFSGLKDSLANKTFTEMKPGATIETWFSLEYGSMAI